MNVICVLENDQIQLLLQLKNGEYVVQRQTGKETMLQLGKCQYRQLDKNLAHGPGAEQVNENFYQQLCLPPFLYAQCETSGPIFTELMSIPDCIQSQSESILNMCNTTELLTSLQTNKRTHQINKKLQCPATQEQVYQIKHGKLKCHLTVLALVTRCLSSPFLKRSCQCSCSVWVLSNKFVLFLKLLNAVKQSLSGQFKKKLIFLCLMRNSDIMH